MVQVRRINKTKPLNTTQKTVLITGITSDIGHEIAIRFAKKGWKIIGHYYSSEKKAGELKDEIDILGVNCYLLRADFSSKTEIIRLDKKLQEFQIDTLINNAGTYTESKHFSTLTIDDMIKTFMVNTFAPMLLSNSLFVRMKERRFGRIVNISSIAAKYGGSSYSMHYGCSKSALEGLTKTLAKEGAEYNVLVNTTRPGVIDTDFHVKFPKDMEKRIAMIPMQRMGNPREVADVVYYLGSDVNSFITNEIITISGGE